MWIKLVVPGGCRPLFALDGASRDIEGSFDQEMEYRWGRAELTATGFAQRGHQARNWGRDFTL